MHKTIRELKSDALLQLRGKWFDSAMTSLALIAVSVASSAAGPWGILVTIFIMGAFMFGFTRYYMNVRDDSSDFMTHIFAGFKSGTYLSAILTYLCMTLFTLLWSLLFIIPGIIAALSYSQSFYILNENPGMSPLNAIEQSKTMMKGHRFRYFLLGLSFLGWILLSVVTVGIALVWVVPYMQTTFANFYADLKANSNQTM